MWRNAVRHSAGSWSSATSRLTAPSPACPSNSDALFPAFTRKGRRGPRTTPPHRTGTSARDPRDYKSQQVVRENRRIPSRLERLPESSASRQSLEIEQNRPWGRGKQAGEAAGAGGSADPRSAAGHRGPAAAAFYAHAPDVERNRPPGPYPRPLLLEPYPRAPLTSGSGPAAASSSRADAAPPLTAASHKPPARTASGPQDEGREGMGEPKPGVAMGTRGERGKCGLMTMAALRLRLAWRLSLSDLLSVPLQRKESGARGPWAAVSQVSGAPRPNPLE